MRRRRRRRRSRRRRRTTREREGRGVIRIGEKAMENYMGGSGERRRG